MDSVACRTCMGASALHNKTSTHIHADSLAYRRGAPGCVNATVLCMTKATASSAAARRAQSARTANGSVLVQQRWGLVRQSALQVCCALSGLQRCIRWMLLLLSVLIAFDILAALCLSHPSGLSECKPRGADLRAFPACDDLLSSVQRRQPTGKSCRRYLSQQKTSSAFMTGAQLVAAVLVCNHSPPAFCQVQHGAQLSFTTLSLS